MVAMVTTNKPRFSISSMHISTTIGLKVERIFTTVVRSTPKMCLKNLDEGWQSQGMSLEHCLCTFNSQSVDKDEETILVFTLFVRINEVF